MRILIITVGIPGAGKSTAIKNLQCKTAQSCVVCPDELRKQYAGLLPYKDGLKIPIDADKKVWTTAKEMVESKFTLGQTAIFDSTGLADLKWLEKMAKAYRYRVIYVVFDDIDIDTCIKRVKQRVQNNQIADEVLYHFDLKLSKFNEKSANNIYKYSQGKTINDAWEWSKYYLQDFNVFDKINIIPDIHGQFNCVEKIDFVDNEAYIFIGDLIDRGTQNVEVIEKIIDLANKPNIFLITGNHDIRLLNWANGLSAKSSGFRQTLKEIELKIHNVDEFKKKIARIATHFKDYLYFDFCGERYFVNHSGVDDMFENIPTALLNGVMTYGYSGTTYDNYHDYKEVGLNWLKNNPNITQIFGHRNVDNIVDYKINERCYCVECSVESGADMKVLQLPHKNIITYKNDGSNVIKIDSLEAEETIDKYIKIKQFPSKGIESHNFSHEVFNKNIWNKATIKARGLYKYIDNGEIAGRSYDKFFNIDEIQPFKKWKLCVKYPVYFYMKYNGYLGILFYNQITKELEFATKSMLGMELNAEFSRLLPYKEFFAKYCKENNVSFVFEVITKNDQPHPINYDKDFVVLLDCFKNTEVEKSIDIDSIDLPKEIMKKETLNIAQDESQLDKFVRFYVDSLDLDYEGVVLKDSNKIPNRLKIKTNFYNIKKALREISNKNKTTYKNGKNSHIIYALHNQKIDWKAIELGDIKKML